MRLIFTDKHFERKILLLKNINFFLVNQRNVFIVYVKFIKYVENDLKYWAIGLIIINFDLTNQKWLALKFNCLKRGKYKKFFSLLDKNALMWGRWWYKGLFLRIQN